LFRLSALGTIGAGVAAPPPAAAGAGLRVHSVPPEPPPPCCGVPVSRAQPATTSALVSTAAARTNPRLIRKGDLSCSGLTDGGEPYPRLPEVHMLDRRA